MSQAMRSQTWLLIVAICLGQVFVTTQRCAADGKSAALKKSISEARTLIKRISSAKPEQLDEITTRLKELDAESVPVRQLLCESIVSAQAAAAKKLMGVLSRVSTETAEDLERLTALPPQTGSSMELFQHYGAVLEELAKRGQPEPGLAPLVKQILANLMKADTAALYERNASVPRELKAQAYGKGVQVLGTMAKTDDGAFAALISLVDLGRAPKFLNSENEVYQLAGQQLATAANGKPLRIRLALASLEANLKKRFTDSQQPDRGGLVGAAAKLVSQEGVTYALSRIAEFGKDAKPLSLLVMQVQQDPRFQQAATSTLNKIAN